MTAPLPTTTSTPIVSPKRLCAARCLAAAIAVVTAATSLAFFFAPGFTFDNIATYVPRNDHLLADLGAFQLAVAVALGGFALRPDQRLGLWVAVSAQSVHAFSHIRDDLIGEVDGSKGFTSAAPNIVSWALVVAVVVLATPRPDRSVGAEP